MQRCLRRVRATLSLRPQRSRCGVPRSCSTLPRAVGPQQSSAAAGTARRRRCAGTRSCATDVNERSFLSANGYACVREAVYGLRSSQVSAKHSRNTHERVDTTTERHGLSLARRVWSGFTHRTHKGVHSPPRRALPRMPTRSHCADRHILCRDALRDDTARRALAPCRLARR